MVNLSEKIADSYRKGTPAKANPANPVTARRRKLYSVIKERTGGDPDAELTYALRIIEKERPKIESYIISKNEVPRDSLQDLIDQAYQLRSAEISSTASMLGVSEGEGQIFLEDDEAESERANNPEQDNFLGEVFAPIGVAAKHLSARKADNFVDPNLISGIVNTIGTKVNSADLKRAAQDKPAGILGFLGSGGTSGYNALRAYFKDPANAAEKAAVLAGRITDTSQLKGYGAQLPASPSGILPQGVNVLGVDVMKAIEDQKKKEAIKKALPFIIIGIAVIILVTVLIVRHGNKNR